MPNYYTRKGDDGWTGLLGDERVPKNHPKPKAYGAVDEASAALGLAKAFSTSSQVQQVIKDVQMDMYHLMAELAATDSQVDKFRTISPEHVDGLEANIEAFGAQVDMPQAFVIPGDTQSSAVFHLARTVVRRAEREVANLAEHDGLSNPSILPYLNRLSSLCFVLSLYEVKSAGVGSPSTTKSEER